MDVHCKQSSFVAQAENGWVRGTRYLSHVLWRRRFRRTSTTASTAARQSTSIPRPRWTR